MTNNVFEKLIKGIYLNLPPKPERKKVNFVARIITKYLKYNNLEGFFDPDEIKCGDDIEHSILSNCQGCFVFVQLVEIKSFSIPQLGKDNWCLKEYNCFKDKNLVNKMMNHKLDKRFYFVITTENVKSLKPAKLPKEYEHWFNHICKLHFTSLHKYKRYKKHIDEKTLREELYELASEIVKTKENILESIIWG